jgi:hypothetical protein
LQAQRATFCDLKRAQRAQLQAKRTTFCDFCDFCVTFKFAAGEKTILPQANNPNSPQAKKTILPQANNPNSPQAN